MTIPIAMGLAAGGSTAVSVYQARSTNKTNQRSLELDERNARREEGLARAAMEQDRARWDDYLRVHEPIWSGAGTTLRSLYGLAGLEAPSAGPAIPAPGSPPPPPGTGIAVPRRRSPPDLAAGPRTGRLPARARRPLQPQVSSRIPSLAEIAQMASLGSAGAPTYPALATTPYRI